METVGDKYMAVSGLPEACENHAKWIAKLALDMMDMAKCVQMGAEPVVSTTLSKHDQLKTDAYTRLDSGQKEFVRVVEAFAFAADKPGN